MPAVRLLAQLLGYYAALAVVILAALWLAPGYAHFLPVGRAQALIGGQAGHGQAAAAAAVAREGLGGSMVWLTSAVLGALAAALPVSWLYIRIRDEKDYDQSLVDTIVVLPVIVTGIVVIVQHSLALSFSLAGIAGAARFRNSLKSTGDLLFMLLAIGIGLSAGIGALELALVLSLGFNLTFVALWATSYGARADMKHFLNELDDRPHAVSVTETTAVVTQVTERFDTDAARS